MDIFSSKLNSLKLSVVLKDEIEYSDLKTIVEDKYGDFKKVEYLNEEEKIIINDEHIAIILTSTEFEIISVEQSSFDQSRKVMHKLKDDFFTNDLKLKGVIGRLQAHVDPGIEDIKGKIFETFIKFSPKALSSHFGLEVVKPGFSASFKGEGSILEIALESSARNEDYLYIKIDHSRKDINTEEIMNVFEDLKASVLKVYQLF